MKLIMAPNKWYIVLLQLIVFGFSQINGLSFPLRPIFPPLTLITRTLSTEPCEPILQNYFDYLTTPDPSTQRYLTIQATFILQNRYVAYYSGSLNYAASIDSLNGTVTVSFSDRTWTPPCDALFCIDFQRFYYQSIDTQTITINRSGSIQYILNSWGNTKSTDQLQCYGVDQPFYTAPTTRSRSMFVMTLQKQQITIPK